MSQHPTNLLTVVNARRAQLAAEVEEFDEPSTKGALACAEGKDGDHANPYDRFDQHDSWDEFRRGYEAEARGRAA